MALDLSDRVEGFFSNKGFQIPPGGIVPDGEVHRFKRDGSQKKEASWYVCFSNHRDDGTEFVAGVLGDWRTNERHKFSTLGNEGGAEVKKVLKQASQKANAERKKRQLEVAKACDSFWNKYANKDVPSEFPYLAAKGLSRGYGAGFDSGKQTLLVPCEDEEGAIWGFQRISADGSKFFMEGQKIQGCFFVLDGAQIDENSRVFVCEGFATAASVFGSVEGSDDPKPIVISAFNAGNLKPVCRALRKKYPKIDITICADNDQWTHDPIENPGVTEAKRAAEAAQASVIIPSFPDEALAEKPTDFNDLMKIEGFDTVRNQILMVAQKTEITVNVNVDGEMAVPSKGHFALWSELNLEVNSKDLPLQNVDNVMRIFERYEGFKDHFWFDSFHQKEFTTWFGEARPLNHDIDPTSLQIYLQRHFGFGRISERPVYAALLKHCQANTRSQPKMWLESLEWDQKPRLYSFFEDYMGAEGGEYSSCAGINWWISMVARIFKPGCKVDNMVILEGAQGRRKSTALEIIAGKWYAVNCHKMDSDDFLTALWGKLIVEVAELESFSKADHNTIKRILSSSIDTIRPKYGRRAGDYDRCGVIVGTTNDAHYLRDDTGNRRFWPIETSGDIDTDRLRKDREQLFAEAVHLYKQGHDWWEMPEEATAQQEARRQADIWEDDIAEAIRFKDNVTTQEVAGAVGIEKSKRDQRASNRISRIMKRLGWKQTTVRRNVNGESKPTRAWIPEKKTNVIQLVKSD